MKIQILSDLHLEYSAFEVVQTDADVIVLAGDICLGTRGIAWARQTWPDKEIVFVPGNHEYYRSEIGIENEQMEIAARVYGVHVLNRKEAVIGEVRFLGATLWTDFRLFGEAERPWAYAAGLNGLTDFRVIDYGPKTFMPQDSAEFNAADVEWLEAKLKVENYDGPTVVVTHHLPSMRSVAERYQSGLLSACFASNFDHLMGYSQLWIHGHTHDSFDYQNKGTRVICNPRGYCKAGQTPENREFNLALVVEVSNEAARLDKVFADFANGLITRDQIAEQTGISWFGDVLEELGKRGLSLPRTDCSIYYNDKQKAIYDEIFSPVKGEE